MTAIAEPAAAVELNFDNSYARLSEAFRRSVRPMPLREWFVASFNRDAAKLLDLPDDAAERHELLAFLAGAGDWPGAEPVAMAYAGHQFGVYVPQLGDGRALLLGEVVNARGERWDLHLKGAGPTPFSRMGDGRAVLRSTIREYLCSEAMHALGIPTTRALCIFGSDEPVLRETVERGAMLVRLAPSHVRFGSFEYFYYLRRPELVRELADYVIALHFQELLDAADPYAAFYQEVVARTARLMAQWQSVGFAHGVMNTDNMSVLGLTLDYGPFGFLDEYDAGFICNHSDRAGRYAFGAQPNVAFWNLACLAQALSPIVEQDALIDGLNSYQPTLSRRYLELMRAKLGLAEARDDDFDLIVPLLEAMQANRVDYTRFFRALGDFDTPDDTLRDKFINPTDFDDWAVRYRERLAAERSQPDERRARMVRVNPQFVLRNYLAQNAITRAEAGDFAELETLLAVLRRPFDEQPGREDYAALPPEWSKKIVVSCSS
jgi:uncharacterized protein YdiU (UPF0061 family)